MRHQRLVGADPVLGDHAVPLLDGVGQLRPGEVRPEAAVLAGAEGDVPVRLPVDDRPPPGSGNIRGSRVADWIESSTIWSFFIGQPWKSTSRVSFRAMLMIG